VPEDACATAVDQPRPQTLAIVIPSKNRKDDLMRCLHSINQHTSPDQVVVIDQSTTPYDLSQFRTVQHVYRPDLSGLTAARNCALQFVRCEYILFLDDDTEVLNDCVLLLKREFSKRPTAAGFGCPTIERWSLTSFSYVLSETIFRRGFFNRRPIKRARGVELRVLPGCAMAVRTDVLAQERFDEVLTGGALGEDFEFSIRARRHGRLWQCESARIRHYGSEQNRPSREKERREAWANNLYFFDKLEAGSFGWNRLWLIVWMMGESIRWIRLGMGLPPFAHALKHRLFSPLRPGLRTAECAASGSTTVPEAPRAIQK
jgi:GT2 family glycosyltransferase